MKKALQIFIVSIFILCIFSITFAQDNKRNKKSQSVKLNPNKPTVYIAPDSNIKLKKLAEANEDILLRLHNNSRWAIWLNVSGGNPEYDDASLYYQVFKKSILEYSKLCHVCSIIPLQSGKSISFSVPKTHLAEDFNLQIQFDFDWGEDSFELGEPIYFVQFYSSDLTKKD